MYAEIHGEFNETNRCWIAHRQQEIGVLIQTSVFCVDKTCFPRPGHICSYRYKYPVVCMCMYVYMCMYMHANLYSGQFYSSYDRCTMAFIVIITEYKILTQSAE